MGFGFEIIKIHRPGGSLENFKVRGEFFDFLRSLFSVKQKHVEKQEIKIFRSDFNGLQRASWTVDFDNFKAKTYQKGSI